MHQKASIRKAENRFVVASGARSWWPFFFILFSVPLCLSLTSESRGELARKFKYYHRSVRPGDRFNLVETMNGTFFALHTEVELLQTSPSDEKVKIELMLNLYYNDERLVLRELQEVVMIPDEFLPWTPQLDFPDNTHYKNSLYLDPRTGQLSIRYRLSSLLECKSAEWNSPFQLYFCKFEVGTSGNENIFPRTIRDLRSEPSTWKVHCGIEQFPMFAVVCKYRNEWLPVIVNIYLPSLLILFIAFFAQWKRRKLQVLVTLAALISLILLKTANSHRNNFTMEDLWLLSTFMHIAALLGIDLVLPARRIIQTTYTTFNSKNLPPNINPEKFSNRSTERVATTTASYKEATQRLLRPFSFPKRSCHNSNDEKSVFLDISSKMPSAYYDLSDIEMADEDGDDAQMDLQRMRTTYVHIHKPMQHNPAMTTSFADVSPSINMNSQKTQKTSSLSASATTVTSPTIAILRRVSEESPISRSQYFITKMTIGRKKKLALASIITCYLMFLVIYVFLTIYILN